jgi:type II secretory pathway pseudopilin PulG
MTVHARRPSGRCAGLSLLELVYVLVLVGVLGSFVVPLVYNMLRGAERMEAHALRTERARYAAERVARELREMGVDPDSGAFQLLGVTSAGLSGSPNAWRALRFRRSLALGGGGASPQTSAADVTVAWLAPRLWLTYDSLGAGAQPLLDEVGDFQVVFFDPTGAELALSATPTLAQRQAMAGAVIRFSVGPAGAVVTHVTRVQLKNRELL